MSDTRDYPEGRHQFNKKVRPWVICRQQLRGFCAENVTPVLGSTWGEPAHVFLPNTPMKFSGVPYNSNLSMMWYQMVKFKESSVGMFMVEENELMFKL